MRIDPPFVLLDDARAGGEGARLYRRPVEVVEARGVAEVRPALERVRAAGPRGLHAAGFLSYEAGEAFEPAAGPLGSPDAPLLWFGLFDRFDEVEDAAVLLPDPAGAWVGAAEPEPSFGDYRAMFERVQTLIRAGDLYQANLSFRAAVTVLGDPQAAYSQLRGRAGAGHGALVDTGADTLVSLSPELFFRLEGRKVTCRPMKGTARRLPDPADDRTAATALAADEKQRAENLMIVDLMRNDLSRVAAAGSVAVPALFSVERYPTVHQMTSTVTAVLAGGHDAADVLAALFPCGSITGAPKVRAMQVLAGIEGGSPRGAYTGAIGRIDANGDAAFNVAIRTFHIAREERRARIGLGGGIVADSEVEAEWDEALAKGAFLTGGRRVPDLIETMAFDPEDGIALLERHLMRLKDSAALLGMAFDRHEARNELQAATFRLRGARRVRLLLGASGRIAIEVSPLPATPARWTAALVPLPVSDRDWRLRHKTTDRSFYDEARRSAGSDEVVFVRPDGLLTEGSFTNLFVARGDRLLTPPLEHGLLPGVLRAELLASGRAEEAPLTADDLSDGFFLGNALRGLVPSSVAVAKGPGRQL